MLSSQEKRILDANRNRITEALRVVEDSLRFHNRGKPATAAKRVRHDVFRIFEKIEKQTGEKLIFHRKSESDPGAAEKYDSSFRDEKLAAGDIITRNIRRACEGLRVCEEISRNIDADDVFKSFKKSRFDLYKLEKDIAVDFQGREKAKRKSVGKNCKKNG
jgi:hypothetical protein